MGENTNKLGADSSPNLCQSSQSANKQTVWLKLIGIENTNLIEV